MRSLFLSSLLLASCAVGPDYPGAPSDLEAAFKNAGFTAPAPQGSWWELYKDPELARLLRLADQAGPSAQAALARYDRARALLGIARADTYPAVDGAAYARRQSDSSNSNFAAGTYNDYRSALNLSWELDLWGRVRHEVGAAAADMQASGYEFQGAALSLRGEVTRAYLSLRFADAEIDLLEQTSRLRGEARRLTKTRFDGGASSRIDYERSGTEHESVLSELGQLRARRGRFENALATLIGQNASGFRVAATGTVPYIPTAPAAVPGDLLRRRPDLAAAERRLAAAYERIGIAIADQLPRITLSAEGGVSSLKSSDLFDPASRLWSIGPEVAGPIVRGGAGLANVRTFESARDESLALYRDTLLRAVEETENALGDSRHLANAGNNRRRGAASANTVAALTRKRYEAGVTDYFEVVDAERTALSEQRAALTIELARALASTALIQSLGGGWQK